jgi:plasmid stabilization system protein ParE
VPWRVSLSDQAVLDLAAIYRWQRQPGSGPAAKRRLQAIRDTIRRLGRYPYHYVRGDHPGTREATCEGHRIIYVVDPDTGRNADAGEVTVLRVFGPGQLRQP